MASLPTNDSQVVSEDLTALIQDTVSELQLPI